MVLFTLSFILHLFGYARRTSQQDGVSVGSSRVLFVPVKSTFC
jgi:hypothetical protein